MRCWESVQFFLIRQQAGAEPLPPGRQLFTLWPQTPELGPVGQTQLRAAAGRLALLSRQPLAQGGDQVIVRQLVEARDMFGIGR